MFTIGTTWMQHNVSPHIPTNILFQWHVTDRCNLRCQHCYQENHSSTDPSWTDLLAILNEFKSFILHYRSTNEQNKFKAHISVTGGEPFIRSDFTVLLEKLATDSQFFSFAILTNGTMLTEASVRTLKLLKPRFVQVSIDGTKETHDRIRGCGSYEQAVRGVTLLVRAGIRTHISFTATRRNYLEFSHVARLGQRLGVSRVWSDRMVPCRPSLLRDDELLSSEETREYVCSMHSEQRRACLRRSPVKLLRALQFMPTGSRPYRCSAGDTLVAVLPNGDVLPCRRLPLIVGNIFKNSLDSLYQSSEVFLRLRNREPLSKGCEQCYYARTCGGGARCIANAVYGSPFHADPGCWIAAGASNAEPRSISALNERISV
jgi:radical SAM protein with 4Fe4S-binding SPASM domain